MPSDSLSFDTNGLYLLLSDIGAERQFHWGFYLAKSPTHGVIFQVVKGTYTTGDKWEYKTKPSINVPNSVNLLVGVKIAVLEPILHNALATRLAEIPVQDSSRYGAITCRVWIKEALQELDDEGYIKLKAKVNDIEEEAVDEAADNKQRERRTAFKSQLSVA